MNIYERACKTVARIAKNRCTNHGLHFCCLLYHHPSPHPPFSLPLFFGETMVKSLDHKHTEIQSGLCVSLLFQSDKNKKYKESTDITPYTHTHTHTHTSKQRGPVHVFYATGGLGLGLCVVAESICPSH